MKLAESWKLWAALGLGLSVGLANVAKPVHVDDTLYLEVAKQIVAHPLDPYGGILNWQQIPERTYNVSISPPLLSYYFALIMLFAGENVIILHLSMIPWLLLATWAVFHLGERWASAGLLTVLLVIGGPAVVVGMNLMLDVPLLACFCASVEFLARSLSGKSPPRILLASMAFASMGVAIKFPAVAIVPVFLVAAMTSRRWGPAFAALGPIAVLFGWQALSRAIYGTSQVDSGMTFLSKLQTSLLPQTVERTLTMTAILAMTFPVWLAVPWHGRRTIGPALLALGAAMTAFWLLRSAPMNRLPIVTPVCLVAMFLGTYSLAGILRPFRSWPSSSFDPRFFLGTWIVSGAAVVILFGPFVAVRSFLPIQPPLAIWLIGSVAAEHRRRIALSATAVVTLTLSAFLALADWHWAKYYEVIAQAIASQSFGPGKPTVMFAGHWGWQYYAERAGFKAWDARRLDSPPGTIVIVPLRADKQFIHPVVLSRAQRISEFEVPHGPLSFTTWNREAGFRFYGGDFGQIPWGFSGELTERFTIYRLGTP